MSENFHISDWRAVYLPHEGPVNAEGMSMMRAEVERRARFGPWVEAAAAFALGLAGFILSVVFAVVTVHALLWLRVIG